MSVEAKRGCGYRKVGGLYLVSGKLAAPCCKLPHLLDVCPCCGAGIKQTRGWTWVSPTLLLGLGGCEGSPARAALCPASNPAGMGERAGLLWIGRGFYKSAEEFSAEVAALGISRRLTAVPRGLVVGKTWVLLAHPGACQPDAAVVVPVGEAAKRRAGVFSIFLPTGIELIVKQSEYDAATSELATISCTRDQQQAAGFARSALSELALRFERDRARGVTWVPVPDGDRDHQGSVYDEEDEEPIDAPPVTNVQRVPDLGQIPGNLS